MRDAERTGAGAASDVLELLRAAVGGVFPGPVIEALIARVEGRR